MSPFGCFRTVFVSRGLLRGSCVRVCRSCPSVPVCVLVCPPPAFDEFSFVKCTLAVCSHAPYHRCYGWRGGGVAADGLAHGGGGSRLPHRPPSPLVGRGCRARCCSPPSVSSCLCWHACRRRSRLATRDPCSLPRPCQPACVPGGVAPGPRRSACGAWLRRLALAVGACASASALRFGPLPPSRHAGPGPRHFFTLVLCRWCGVCPLCPCVPVRALACPSASSLPAFDDFDRSYKYNVLQ